MCSIIRYVACCSRFSLGRLRWSLGVLQAMPIYGLWWLLVFVLRSPSISLNRTRTHTRAHKHSLIRNVSIFFFLVFYCFFFRSLLCCQDQILASAISSTYISKHVQYRCSTSKKAKLLQSLPYFNLFPFLYYFCHLIWKSLATVVTEFFQLTPGKWKMKHFFPHSFISYF